MGDEPFVAQINELHRRPSRQPVLGRQRDHQRLVPQSLADQPRIPHRPAHDPDVDLAVLDRAQLRPRPELAQAQLHVRISCRERAHQRRDDPERRRVDEAERQRPGDPMRDHPHRFEGDVGLREHRARLRQQGLAGVGEDDAPARPLEQRHAQLVLQLADLLAERRLRDMQRLGGAAKTALLSDQALPRKKDRFLRRWLCKRS